MSEICDQKSPSGTYLLSRFNNGLIEKMWHVLKLSNVSIRAVAIDTQNNLDF